jgi:hypothetical protein
LKWRVITRQSTQWRQYKCRAVQWKLPPMQPLPKPHPQRQPLPLQPPQQRQHLLRNLQLTPRSNLHLEQPAMLLNSAWRVFSL